MTDPKKESFLSLAIAKSHTNSELSTSSEETDVNHKYSFQPTEDSQRLEAEHQGWKEIHGFRGNQNWNSPYRLKKEFNQTLGNIVKNPKHMDYEDE